jgi:hypothetical protein
MAPTGSGEAKREIGTAYTIHNLREVESCLVEFFIGKFNHRPHAPEDDLGRADAGRSGNEDLFHKLPGDATLSELSGNHAVQTPIHKTAVALRGPLIGKEAQNETFTV